MRTLSATAATMLTLLMVHADLAAQMGGDPEVHRAAMERLDFLVGGWEGDGWLLQRDGRHGIRQSEVVRYELGGTILVIEGTARQRAGDRVGDVIFNAFAVVSWNPDSGFQMRSYLWNGLEDTRPLEVGQGSFSWGQGSPGGPVEYHMELTAEGAWHEVGTMTRPDGASMDIVDFRLARTGR
ncbi:MAG TPA: hypothetical protein VJ997_00870 [Longimicrobiales bacterium]|nr:hypothetical protein [Longimicrobiales bacterium]